MKKLLQSSFAGFTLVEAMLGIMIATIGVTGMLTGVVYAHGIMRTTQMKERAFEELRIEMEYWKAVAAEGSFKTWEASGDPIGKEVVLDKASFGKKKDIVGKITRRPVRKVPDGSIKDRYELEMTISWEDHNMLFAQNKQELTLSMVMGELK